MTQTPLFLVLDLVWNYWQESVVSRLTEIRTREQCFPAHRPVASHESTHLLLLVTALI